MENLLTIQEAAKFLRVSHITIRDWLNKGHIIGLRIPGTRKIYIRKEDLESRMKGLFEKIENVEVKVNEIKEGERI